MGQDKNRFTFTYKRIKSSYIQIIMEMKKYILFNTNIIIAGLTGLLFAMITSSIAQENFAQVELTTAIATITHFWVYFLVNSFLHYIQNKKKYTGNIRKYLYDLGKIYITQLPTFVIYYILFFWITYILLHVWIYVIPSTVIAWFIWTLFSRIIHTYLAEKAGFFK